MASNDKGLEEIPEGKFQRHFLSVLVGVVLHCQLQTFLWRRLQPKNSAKDSRLTILPTFRTDRV